MSRRGRKIRTTPDKGMVRRITLGGWLSGRRTYLWIGDVNGNCLNTISGQKLYRLAKAIVAQFERAK